MADRQGAGLPRPSLTQTSAFPRQPTTSAIPASSTSSSASRFGYRAPGASSIPAATPLGKRTASSTSFHDAAASSSAVKRSTVRSSMAGPETGTAATTSTGPRSPMASHQLSTLKTHYESRLLLSQQSYDSLEDEYRVVVNETERLKSERRGLLEEWEQAKAARAVEVESWKSEKQAWKQKETEMKRGVLQLEEELHTAKQENSHQRQESQAKVMQLSTKVSQLEAEKAQADEAARDAQQQKLAEVNRRQEFEARVQELENRLLKEESEVSDRKNGTAIVNQELNRILVQSNALESQLYTLKSSNETLRKQAQAASLLREENADLKRNVDAMGQLRQQVVEYQARADQTVSELEDWNSFLASSQMSSSKIEAQTALTASDRDEPLPNIPDVPLPLTRSSLPVYLASLRGTASGLITRCRILNERLQRSEAEVAGVRKEVQTSETELGQRRQGEADWRVKEQSWNRSREEWQDEVRRYRELLQSYEHESGPDASKPDQDEKMEDISDEDKKTDNSIARGSSSQLERISLLEQDLQYQRSEVVRVSEEKDGQIAELRREAEACASKISELRTSIAELQGENANLDEQLGRAEERLGKGEFDVTAYRCLVLKDNPIDRDRDLRKSTMDLLEKENEELKKRVQDVGNQLANMHPNNDQSAALAGGDQSEVVSEREGWMPASVVETLREEVDCLSTKVASREKAMLRQKESFGDLARIYRATIESLFGFKMQFHGNRLVEVHSILNKAVRAEHTRLLFKWKAPGKGQKGDGETVLCDDEGNARTLAKFSEHSSYWLSEERYRMPCFLGAMQMSVYEDVTMAVRSTWRVPDEGEEGEG